MRASHDRHLPTYLVIVEYDDSDRNRDEWEEMVGKMRTVIFISYHSRSCVLSEGPCGDSK